MGLLALALAPGFAISLFIYLKDRYNREPWRALLFSFLLGMISIVPAIALEMTSGITVEGFVGQSVQRVALEAFGVVALSEEGCKLAMVLLYAFRSRHFDDPFDGIVYAVMVSMGFATLENIGYVMNGGYATAILRMFLSVPAHACFGVLMGYYLGLAKFDAGRRPLHLLRSLAWPVLFHGAFDFFLFLGYPLLQIAGALASFVIALRLSRKAIRQHQALSANHASGGNDYDKGDHSLL